MAPFIFALTAAFASHCVAAEDPRACGATLPDAVRALAPVLAIQGEGELRWFGVLVYHARLWSTPGGWRPDAASALEIRYERAIRGAALAARSIDEMRHNGAGTDAQHGRWRDRMAATFPDVERGDRLVGLALPNAPTRFFLNGRPVGNIDDPAFAAAFFGIWLSPTTSRPDLRRMLLRLPE